MTIGQYGQQRRTPSVSRRTWRGDRPSTCASSGSSGHLLLGSWSLSNESIPLKPISTHTHTKYIAICQPWGQRPTPTVGRWASSSRSDCTVLRVRSAPHCAAASTAAECRR
eukprot:scaffold1920_cov242-Prasinococcus_capsulatus_cf.AAC.1